MDTANKQNHIKKELSPPNYDQLITLLDTARFMGEERNLIKLLEFLAKKTSEALNADRCSIFILDKKKREIWSQVQLGEDTEIRFPEGTGIAGQTISTGKPILIDDAYSSPLFNPNIDSKTGYKTKNILCVPMKNTQGKIIGCFEMINKIDGQFTKEDESFLFAFGGQAAVAIESAILYGEKEKMIKDLSDTQAHLKQKMEQMQIIYELEEKSNEITSNEDFITNVIHKAIHAIDADAGSILSESPAKKVIYFYSPLQNNGNLKTTELGQESYNNLIPPKAQIINHCNEESTPNSISEIAIGKKAKKVLSIPLDIYEVDKEGEKSIHGLLEIVNYKERNFSKEDLSFMEIIESQLSKTIAKKRLLEERSQSQRLATIGQISSTIFHDFKNPMSIIQGLAQIIEESELPKEQITKFCKIIMKQVDRCTSMVEELLAFARGEKNYTFKKIPMEDFIDEISHVLQVECDRQKIAFTLKSTYQNDVIMDKDKLTRVIFNLTNNAFEILKEGDSLALTCCPVENNMVEIRITDSGPGVPKHLQANIFDAFVTHGKASGTGLGLHIAKDIAEGHGGKIFLDTTIERGASFVIHLKQDPTAT